MDSLGTPSYAPRRRKAQQYVPTTARDQPIPQPMHKQNRTAARFRLSCHKLRVELGRHEEPTEPCLVTRTYTLPH